MWREYSVGFIKKNRASSISVMVAAFIASLLLSVLCSFFYNMWVYDVESVIAQEGDWQARVAGTFDGADLELISSFANVEKAVVNSGDSGITVIDLYFYNPRTIWEDMTLMSEKCGLRDDQVTYNYQLLAMYFIRIPGDSAPRLVMPLYFAVVFITAVSLILVIHNSFAVSMNARIHQLGILSGIGATPRQIGTCLVQEAAWLCAFSIVLGSLAGAVAGGGLMRLLFVLAMGTGQGQNMAFRYHPLIFIVTIAVSGVTVLVSASIPAGKLAKLTPLEAIRGAEELTLKRKKHSPFLSLLFGVEGELAGNALRAQKKALRTSTLSLTLSFLGFMIILCFFSLSEISTEHTYFARYQDVWDVMAAVKGVRIEAFAQAAELAEAQKAQGAASCVIYQKAHAAVQIPEEQLSDELLALGGIAALSGGRAQADIVIMDDGGFLEYCGQIGAAPRLDGLVVVNRIWDSVHSNFRYRKYIPYLKEKGADTMPGKEDIPVIAYTDEEPLLREEYNEYALVCVMPLSLWKDIADKGDITDVEPDVFIRVLADGVREKGGETESGQRALEELERYEEVIAQFTVPQYETEIENRIREKTSNDGMILGYKIILGTFCVILAVIGIANIFSYTMGFLRQRRREFARYLSVGMTPGGLKKLFCIEIMVIAGRPVLLTLPLVLVFVEFAVKASYLNPAEFWARAPVIPAAVFIAAVFGFVILAYYLGARRILQDDLAEALRNDAVA